MINENKEKLERYLGRLWPQWKQEIPHLLRDFEELHLESGEHLPSQRGDIYFIASGIVGKYIKNAPIRYSSNNEVIIVPLKPSTVQFRVLADATVFVLERSVLYQIVEQHPRSIMFYDELLIKQQQAIDFRYDLLQLPKAARLDALRTKYPPLMGLLSRTELAAFLDISKEYLRRLL
ncbi:hypothetical protein PQ465_11490 [Sphingobacterium oryzagri]|uniref:Crp/Fnr family transcriptional regulator n=1 Tax=Sphingobacterium oryzagri TaxID=3025669 RepID=A0ABY7WHQ3_9SPHI|nr:hypothetical protein [Sphingobacterium sp. KACC 22765]WDF66929.1 hypothetical protein PQ465_11490 [Sphingobacterium sp. KACC 22765]